MGHINVHSDWMCWYLAEYGIKGIPCIVLGVLLPHHVSLVFIFRDKEGGMYLKRDGTPPPPGNGIDNEKVKSRICFNFLGARLAIFVNSHL